MRLQDANENVCNGFGNLLIWKKFRNIFDVVCTNPVFFCISNRTFRVKVTGKNLVQINHVARGNVLEGQSLLVPSLWGGSYLYLILYISRSIVLLGFLAPLACSKFAFFYVDNSLSF